MMARQNKKTTKIKASKPISQTKKPEGFRKIFELNSLRAFVFKRKTFTIAVLFIILATLLYIGKGIFIAAMVDGKPIMRLSVIRELERQAGKQALESLITKELISQEARKNNIFVTDTVVQAEIENLKKNFESQGSTLDAALATQGQTMADLQQNIKYQKMVEELLKEKISVSDEELQKYFEENKKLYAQGVKYEDLKENLRRQLQQEKLSKEFKAWMDKLRSESNVVYFVNF